MVVALFFMEEVMKQGRRRLIRHGGSVGITFPVKFLKDSQLKVGDKVAVVFDNILVIVKPELKEQAPKDKGVRRMIKMTS